MAQVPGVPLPSVGESAAPTPTVNVTPPASAFGANVLGAGLQDAGQAAGKVSDALAQHAIVFQQLNNKHDADTAFLGATDTIDKTLADYKVNNPGMAAYNNLPQLYENLEGIRAKAGEGLNPMARMDYEANSRRALQYALSGARDFATQQRTKSIVETGDAVSDRLVSQGIIALTGSDGEQQAVQGIAANAATIGVALGWSPEKGADYVFQKTGAIYAGQIKLALDGGDIDTAHALLKANGSKIPAPLLEQVAGALRASDTANEIAVKARVFADGGTAPTVSGVSSGPWDKGVAPFRANASATIGSLLGTGPVVVTSGARSAEGNAAVGGSPSSEHLTNSAWDFIPPHGQSVAATGAQLVAALHAQNIPFDQVEIDPTNGHVHVGFGPKNRGEMIDNTGRVLQAGAPQSASAPITTPGFTFPANVEPETAKAEIDTQAHAYALAQYPDNAAMAEKLEMTARQEAYRKLDPVIAQQKAAQANIINYAIEHPDITTTAQLPPELTTTLGTLPSTARTDLDRTLSYNQYRLSAQHPDVTGSLDNMIAAAKKGDAQALAALQNTDVTKLPLSPSDIKSYQARQADALHAGPGSNQMAAFLRDPVVAQVQATAFPHYKTDPQQASYRLEFLGQLSGSVEALEAQGKTVTPEQVRAIAQQLVLTHPVAQHNELFGVNVGAAGTRNASNVEVPADAAARITAQYQRTLHRAPTAEELGHAYARYYAQH